MLNLNKLKQCYLTIVPTFSPFIIFSRFPGLFISKTIIGRLFSLHNVKAVMSMTFSPSENTVANDSSSYFTASAFLSGSELYIPSTLVPLRMTSAFISFALSAAAESVVK